MIDNLINITIMASLGIAYLFGFSKVQQYYFSKISIQKNHAILILYLSSIVSAAINLFQISDAASDAVLFFLDREDFLKACLYAIGFFTGTWIFSILLFRLSFLVIGNLTKENEIDELIKNNIEIAWLHALILISLTFVIAPALVKIAISFIPYPELPF